MKTFKYIIAGFLSGSVLSVAGVMAHFIGNPFIYMPVCVFYGMFVLAPCINTFVRWAEK